MSATTVLVFAKEARNSIDAGNSNLVRKHIRNQQRLYREVSKESIEDIEITEDACLKGILEEIQVRIIRNLRDKAR